MEQENLNTADENHDKISAKKKINKLFIIVPAALAFLAIACVICIVIFGGKNDGVDNNGADVNGNTNNVIEQSGKYRFKDKAYVLKESDGNTLVVQGESLIGTADGLLSIVSESYDGGVALLQSYEGDNLYSVKDCDVKKISSKINVKKAIVAAKGEYFSYVDTDGNLYHVKTGNENGTFIAEGVSSFRISPDGKMMVYTVGNREDTDGGQKLCFYNGKESFVIADGYYYAWGLSDNGEQIYAESLDFGVYVFTEQGKVSKKIADGSVNPVVFEDSKLFNKDNTQLLFYTNEGTFVYSKEQDAVKINEEYLSPVYPEYIAKATDYYISSVYLENLLGNVYSPYRWDIADGYFSLYYVDEKGETTDFVNKAYGPVRMSRDGSTVYYYSESNYQLWYTLCKRKVEKSATEQHVADEVAYYEISANGAEVYYSSLQGDLYYKKGDADSKRLTDDIEVSWLRMTSNDMLIVCAGSELIVKEDDRGIKQHDHTENNLYVYQNGEIKKMKDGIWDITVTYNTVIYNIGYSDNFELYAGSGDGKYKKIASGLKNAD